jgi:hypothetical protein
MVCPNSNINPSYANTAITTAPANTAIVIIETEYCHQKNHCRHTSTISGITITTATTSTAYISVSQTMVRGPQVVLEVCPCGSSKKAEEKIKFK